MASSTSRDSLFRASALVAGLFATAPVSAQVGDGNPGMREWSTRQPPTNRAAVTDAAGQTTASTAQSRGAVVLPPPPGRDLDQDLARSAMARGLVLPLDRVLKKVADFVPGDVLDVHLIRRPEALWVYEIRMLSDDGRIRLVVVDATRNTVLEVRRP